MKSPQGKTKKWRRRSPEECRRIVSNYFSSGESLWQFSQRTAIGYGSLRNWVKRYGPDVKVDGRKAQSFVELPPSTMGAAGIAATVRFASGTEVALHSGCSTALVQTLIKSLR